MRLPRWRAAVPLLALTATAVAARLVALGSESIWLDEAVSLKLAAAPLGDLLAGVARDEGNPWGYWVLLKAWQRLFGPGLEAARGLSAVFGALVVPATFFLAREDGLRRNDALVAGLLAAVSPPLVFLGREARVYAVFAVTVTLTAWAAAAIRRERRLAHPVFSAGAIAMLYLHYYAFFIIPTLVVAVLWRRPLRSPATWRLLAALAGIGLAFAPLLPLLRSQLSDGTTRSAETWWLHAAMFPYHAFVGHTLAWKLDPRWLLAVAYLLVVLGVAIPCAWILLRERSAPVVSAIAGLGTFLVVVLVSIRSPLLHSRYMVAVVPCLLIVLAAALQAMRLKHRLLTRLAVALGGLTLAASLARLYLEPHKPDWRGVAGLVGATAPGLPVYFLDNTGAGPYSYYRPSDTLIGVPVSADGKRWRDDRALVAMHAHRGDFWLAMYLPYAHPTEVRALADEFSWYFPVARNEERFGIRVLLVRRARTGAKEERR